MKDLVTKAATLLEALPYIQKFSHATFVVKYGGSFMDSPDPAVRSQAGDPRTSTVNKGVFLQEVLAAPVGVRDSKVADLTVPS